MGRAALHAEPAIVESAARLAAKRGPAALTIQAVATASGAPVGSIYHRFPSRGALLARVWLDKAECFQGEFLRRLDAADRWCDGLSAASYTPEFASADPVGARILLVYSRRDFLSGDEPPEHRERASALGEALNNGLARFCHQVLGGSQAEKATAVRFALMDAPLAATKPWISDGRPPPAVAVELVRHTYLGVGTLLGVGSACRSPGSGEGSASAFAGV